MHLISPRGCLPVYQSVKVSFFAYRARVRMHRKCDGLLCVSTCCCWATTHYFGPQLVIVWLHLQKDPCHLAPRTFGVVRGTQTKRHTQSYREKDVSLTSVHPTWTGREFSATNNNNKLISCSFVSRSGKRDCVNACGMSFEAQHYLAGVTRWPWHLGQWQEINW